MPSPSLNSLLKAAPKEVTKGWTRETLAAAIASLLALWMLLYGSTGLAEEVKRSWKT